MRRAKQGRSDELAEKAQRMATERSNQIAYNLNQQTNAGVTRSVEAQRDNMREVALESSILGRQGKALEQTATPKYQPQNAQARREPVAFDANMVSRRKEQARPLHAGESVPPGYQRAIDRNDTYPISQAQPRIRAQSARPTPSFEAQSANAQAPVRAYGLTSNPVDDSRRRKKLEAHIRALAANE